MNDSDVMQDFFDAFEVVNRLNAIVNVNEFLAGRHGLLEYAPKADSDPKHVLSCIKVIYKGIGPRLFKSFITMENIAPAEGLDDVWGHWCPCPVELHKQEYPAGTIPLWSSGESTVFARLLVDKHGNEEFGFSHA